MSNLAIEAAGDREWTDDRLGPAARAILIAIQWETNVGYAFLPLERTFYEMALALTGDPARVHFAYRDLGGGPPGSLPPGFSNLIGFDSASEAAADLQHIADYVRDHGIDTVFGFDWGVHLPCYRTLRRAGVKTIVAYWGAPMGGLHRGLGLLLRKLDVARRPFGPDHYIFESQAMRETAIHGRGIPTKRTSVVYLGVDCERFRPAQSSYVYKAFSIPPDRKVIFYSGHMLERKGVHIIVAAAAELVNRRGRRDLHFLFAGDRPGEAQRFDPIYRGTPAEDFITFGGYRHDLPDILPGCYAGVIASVGWDSLTMSSMEMQACGLPLIVSDGSSPHRQGLREAIEDGLTGYLFPLGDVGALADRLARLAADRTGRDWMSRAARARVERQFTVAIQRHGLVDVMEGLLAKGCRAPRERAAKPHWNPIAAYLVRHGGRRAIATQAWHALRSLTGAFEQFKQVNWQRVSRMVFVCKGNLCRSPFAAQRCRALGIRAVSAGLETESGRPADPTAALVAKRFGIDLAHHRTTAISDLDLADGDLLVAFEPDHTDRLRQLCAHGPRVQVTLIGLWSDSSGAVYLHDPYGLPEAYFERCFNRIDLALDGLRRQWTNGT